MIELLNWIDAALVDFPLGRVGGLCHTTES